MRFTKMQGAGNDFIIINNIDGQIDRTAYSRIAATLCPRHTSVGADGLMVIEPAEQGGDFGMMFYNADGMQGEMCGNGARCIAKYGFENGLAGGEMTIETTAGLVKAWRISPSEYRLRLNDVTVLQDGLKLEALGKTYTCTYVELGNPGLPHLVVEMPGLRDMAKKDLFNLGLALRSHPTLPKGANVNFYDLTGEDRIFERTFERGVEDFTYACGTGTGSVVSVLTLQGKVSGRNVEVSMEGGILHIDIVREGDTIEDIYLTGPAITVYEAETGEVW
ncbi:MAG: diaminopimelate epimerase [Firmicutes bacterium]|nr:diaminopimelate epimerase [Bacillota bacterium]